MRSAVIVALLLAASPASAQTIVLDPGHGGADPGAVGCEDLHEAPTVLDVVQRTRSLLEAEGLTVELTRDDDRAISLAARVAFANDLGADLFVAVHSNANGGTPATGTETWIANAASSTSATMAGHLQREMIAAWGLADRGVKRRDFAVIANTRMPAALTELAFTNRCDPDALLLRDPAARADAAEAHARAVLLTLGRDPDGISPPMTGTGVLRGVVFEDVGAGLEDTSRRLDAARVVISGTAHDVDAETAHFTFNFAPGAYTLEAQLEGYTTTSRTCTVTDGGETWCSVGLMTTTTPPVTPPTPMVDGGPPTPPVLDAGTPTPGAESPMDPGPDGGDRPDEVGGCSAGGTPGASPLLALLLLGVALLGLRRRAARSAGVLNLALVGCTLIGCTLVGCTLVGGGDPAHTAAPLGETIPTDHAAVAVEQAEVVDPFARLGSIYPVASGLVAPVISADGTRLAMSNPDHSQLWLMDRGDLELVAEGPRAGYRPVFSGSALRYRHAEQSSTAVPHYAIELEGPALPETPATAWVRLDDEHRVVLLRRGSAPRVISREGDRALRPRLAPDGAHVVYWEMSRGVFLYRVADGRLVHLGRGGHPSFDETGRWVVFDRTEDDGHQLTSGELWIADAHQLRVRVAPLTATPETIEHSPSLANGHLAFATPRGVLIGTLTFLETR